MTGRWISWIFCAESALGAFWLPSAGRTLPALQTPLKPRLETCCFQNACGFFRLPGRNDAVVPNWARLTDLVLWLPQWRGGQFQNERIGQSADMGSEPGQ
jgi:hypothetical protein